MKRYWLTKTWQKRIFGTIFAATVINAFVGCRWQTVRADMSRASILWFSMSFLRDSLIKWSPIYIKKIILVLPIDRATQNCLLLLPALLITAAKSKHKEMGTLKAIRNGKNQCRYINCHRDSYHYCKTYLVEGKFLIFVDLNLFPNVLTITSLKLIIDFKNQ